MNPPANASIEKSADSRSTTDRDRPSPNRRRTPSPAAALGGASIAGGKPAEADRHRDPDQRVADDDRPVGVDRGEPAVDQRLADDPGTQRSRRGGDVAGQVVPGERRGPASVWRRLRQPGLLDCQEWPDLVAGRRDHPDRGGQDQERWPARHCEDETRADHQQGPGDENAAASDPIGVRRQPERDERVADERQGQDDPDRQRIEAQRRRDRARGRPRGTRSRTSGGCASRRGAARSRRARGDWRSGRRHRWPRESAFRRVYGLARRDGAGSGSLPECRP